MQRMCKGENGCIQSGGLNAADRRTESTNLQGEGALASAKPPIASDGKAEEFCGNILRYHKIPVSKSSAVEKGQEITAQGSSGGTDSTIGI